MDDGFQRGVQHLGNGIDVRAGIEKIADVQRLEPLVAVELLVVGVGDGFESGFVCGGQHRFAVAPKVGAGHGHDMCLVAGNEVAQLAAQLVVWVTGNVVELVDGNQPVVERGNAQFVHRKAKGGVGADQRFVGAGKERAHGFDLGLGYFYIVCAWGIA